MKINRNDVNAYRNPLLENAFIIKFDFDKSKVCVDKLMEVIGEWKYAYINLIPPKITPNYEIKYEKFDFKVSDGVGDYVQKKVDMERKIDNTYLKLKKIMENLNVLELDYFDMTYYQKLSDVKIENRLNIGHTQLIHIKKSCIIKIALGLEGAVKN